MDIGYLLLCERENLSLRGSEGERAGEAALGKFNFEGIAGARPGSREGSFGGGAEVCRIDRLAGEGGLGLGRAPGSRANSAERDANAGDVAVADSRYDCGGGESE